jgi:UDP-N-acetylmuramate--alanine ligase
VDLQVPGKHNVANAVAAAALAIHCGASASAISRALADFGGLRRRMESVGVIGGVAVLDDYAHHPTEVAASLAAVREMYPGRRLWCVFQPHQASRTACLIEGFARSLRNADKIIVADIYRAREPGRRPGEIRSADLAARIRNFGGDVLQVHAIHDIQDLLDTALQPLDVLITMGAGDIGKVAHGLDKRFRENRAAG